MNPQSAISEVDKKPPFDRLRYSPDTGIIVWEGKPPSRRVKSGARAGFFGGDGYRQIKVGYRQYGEHRVAWFLHYGTWPDGEIDHINGDRCDNRIENLRVVEDHQNAANRVRKSTATSRSFKGVCFRPGQPRKPWAAYIVVKGKKTYLGGFATEHEAGDAYRQASIEMHGEHSVFNRAFLRKEEENP
jgi:hypothetical protein